jgi:hypothetical protein
VTLNRVGATLNREQLGYEVMGMPAQQRLIMNVPGLAAFSDPQKLDGMDLASTKLALTKMAAQSSSAKNFGQIVSPLLLFGVDPGGKLPGMIEKERAAAQK